MSSHVLAENAERFAWLSPSRVSASHRSGTFHILHPPVVYFIYPNISHCTRCGCRYKYRKTQNRISPLALRRISALHAALDRIAAMNFARARGSRERFIDVYLRAERFARRRSIAWNYGVDPNLAEDTPRDAIDAKGASDPSAESALELWRRSLSGFAAFCRRGSLALRFEATVRNYLWQAIAIIAAYKLN